MACEAILDALASAVVTTSSSSASLGGGLIVNRGDGVISVSCFRAWRDLLAQAERSHTRISLDRMWDCGIRALITLASPKALGLLPLIEALRQAPEHFNLLAPMTSSSKNAEEDNGDALPLSSRVLHWLRGGGGATHGWYTHELSDAVIHYLEAYTPRADRYSPPIPSRANSSMLHGIVPSVSDLDDAAEEARTLASASAMCPCNERVSLLLKPLCDSLLSIHARPYLHPLHAPRLMLLLQSALHPNIGGIASTDDAKARFDAAAFVSSCADACAGFLDTCILSAQAHPSDRSNTEESEWLCGRVVTCATSLASYAAAFPDLPALSSMIAERLLPTLSCLCEKEHTLGLMAAKALAGVAKSLSLGTYGVKVTQALTTAAATILSFICGVKPNEADETEEVGEEEEEAEASSSSPPSAEVSKLRYACDVSRWTALDALLTTANDLRHSISLKAVLPSMINGNGAWMPLCSLIPECYGDDIATHVLFRCAYKLLLIRNSVAFTDTSVLEAHSILIEGLRRYGRPPTAALCTDAADFLFSPQCLSAHPLLTSACQSAFTYFMSLGSTRPFAAKLCASRVCRWALTSPYLAATEWIPQLQTLLVFGDHVPKGGGAISAFDDADLTVSTSLTRILTDPRPKDRRQQTVCQAVVDGCETAVEEAIRDAEASGQAALQVAVSDGGGEAIHKASLQQVRALALRLLYELPPTAAEVEMGW